MKISGLIIAAGASRRLGQPKQLVQYRGKTLIEHAIDIMRSADLADLSVVLGSNADLIKETLNSDIHVLYNRDWSEGMGTTIRHGVQSLAPSTDAVLIMLVDQYMLSEALMAEMIQAYKKAPESMVVCHYATDTYGPPAIFPRRYFGQLLELNGDRGAGKIIQSELKHHSEKVIIIEFAGGHMDVDVPTDLENLNQ